MAQSSASLALAVSAIALPDSLNPSLIGVATYLAARPNPRRRTVAFTAAAFVVTLAGGALLAVGLGDLGAGVAGIELVTAFPYFAAIAIIVGSSVSDGAKTFLLILYNVVYLLPLLAIVAMCFVMGNRAGPVLLPVGLWINTHWPIVVAPLAATVGVAVVIYGIAHLA